MQTFKPYIILLLLIAVLQAQGQSFFFKNHPLKEPFHNAQLRALYQDSQSLLWLTTSKGVLSYNGQTFEALVLPEQKSTGATAFFQDRTGTYWLGYEDGTIARGSYRTISTWTAPDTLFHSPIVAFEEDEQGRLWIATYGQGVFCWDGRTLSPLSEWIKVPVPDDVYVMVKDTFGHLLIGTDSGILKCKPRTHESTCQLLGVDDGLQDHIVRALLPDASGGFWVGTYDNGVSYYSAATRSFQHLTPQWDKGPVTALAAFSGRELWIGTADQNAWIYSYLNKQLRAVQSGTAGPIRIADLHTDPEGNLWMIQNNRLLQTHRQLEFLQTDYENIQAIVMDRKNRLWIGTPEGLFFCEPLHRPEVHFAPAMKAETLNVISLYEDRFGLIWVGTFGDGVYCFDPDSGRFRVLDESDGLLNGSILSISGKADQVWLATLGGVTEVDNTRSVLHSAGLTLHNYNQNAGLGTNYIYKTFVDSKDRIWFATDGKGISVFEAGRITNYPHAVLIEGQDTLKMPLKAVYSITEDHNGHIWFSTDREGIFEFDGTHFRRLTVKEGIRDLAILSLTTDVKGNIIIVHSSGLDLLQPENHHIIYYDQSVGIDAAAPNLNTACTDQYGHVWIGFNREIIKYVPLNEALAIHPRTQLVGVKVLGEAILMAPESQFSHRENYLEFEYRGLWYTDPEKVKFRYRLTGYDRDWIETKDNQVTYSKLPPGNYRFELTSTENEAWLDEPIITYTFKVDRPFWLKWWFVFGSIVLLSGGFLYYQRKRDERLQRVNLLQKEKVLSQFEAIKSQINPHILFNSFNTLLGLIEENPKKAAEYVERFSDYYRAILYYRDKALIPVEEELELIRNFSYLLKTRFGEAFNLRIDLPDQIGYVVPLSLQVLVENAVKHNIISKSKPLYIEIRLNAAETHIEVINNLQLKTLPVQSTRFGLASLEKRYELLNGKRVLVERTADHFTVSIPLAKDERS